jgi:hypothetical protein
MEVEKKPRGTNGVQKEQVRGDLRLYRLNSPHKYLALPLYSYHYKSLIAPNSTM